MPLRVVDFARYGAAAKMIGQNLRNKTDPGSLFPPLASCSECLIRWSNKIIRAFPLPRYN